MWHQSAWGPGSPPVEGPVEEELARGAGEAAALVVRLQGLGHHAVQPPRPLLQGAVLLQRGLEVMLQPLHHTLLTLTHPRRLLLQGPAGEEGGGGGRRGGRWREEGDHKIQEYGRWLKEHIVHHPWSASWKIPFCDQTFKKVNETNMINL